jgi:hypothetical protein
MVITDITRMRLVITYITRTSFLVIPCLFVTGSVGIGIGVGVGVGVGVVFISIHVFFNKTEPEVLKIKFF